MRKIGIMGGTFNPIHAGHLMLAEAARDEFMLDEVWFVPTGCSYMKQNTIDDNAPLPEERLEMVRLAVEGNPYFRCLDMEVKREGYTYTYETLEELKALYPHDEFYFIFGADCLYGIEKWKEPKRIFATCRILAVIRDGFAQKEMQKKIQQLQESFGACIYLLPFRELQISSTEIRNRVCAGKSIRYMVPDSVNYYIEEKGFYGS